MKKISAFIFALVAVFSSGATFSQVIPKGKVEHFIFNESRIFPGTTREVYIYIPQQLDTLKPACVYVQQDGHKLRSFPAILDTLISGGDIPALVGVFVQPGRLTPPVPNTVPRSNRGFEYDGLGDNYARFILEELLPVVAKKYNLNLSDDGNNRAIGGASSGGIAAFNAAWERPDAFSRVYCNSGSFVAFRGGNEFPALVRKTEPKPVRAFLTVGTDDMENAAGDWTLINMQMDKALKFSGYDYELHVFEGPHVVRFQESFSDAMRFLWHNWPAKIKAGNGAPRVQDIIIPGENWNLVQGNFANAKGAANNQQGEVYFIDSVKNKICKIDTNGIVQPIFSCELAFSDLTFDAENNLIAISSETAEVWKLDSDGNKALIATEVEGAYVTATPGGNILVSGNKNHPGQITIVRKNGSSNFFNTGMKSSLEVAVSPDQWLLAVADSLSHRVYSFDLSQEDSLKYQEPYYRLHVPDRNDNSGALSVSYDREGHVYAATKMGIQVCAWDGPVQVILPMPEKEAPTNVCLGGNAQNELFVFCGDKIYRRKVKTHALGAFSPWMKREMGKL